MTRFKFCAAMLIWTGFAMAGDLTLVDDEPSEGVACNFRYAGQVSSGDASQFDETGRCDFHIDAVPWIAVHGAQTRLDGLPLLPWVPLGVNAETTEKGFVLLEDTDLIGADLTQTGHRNVSRTQCEQICRNDAKCGAYTWVRDTAWCFPKVGIKGDARTHGWSAGGLIGGPAPRICHNLVQFAAIPSTVLRVFGVL